MGLIIESFVLKLVYTENFMMFEHSGRELRRFENFVFTLHLYGISCYSDFFATAEIPFKCVIKTKCSKRP
jgi:hypothetical protein